MSQQAQSLGAPHEHAYMCVYVWVCMCDGQNGAWDLARVYWGRDDPINMPKPKCLQCTLHNYGPILLFLSQRILHSLLFCFSCQCVTDSLPLPLPCQPEGRKSGERGSERAPERERERGNNRGKGNKRNVQSTIIQEPFSVLFYATTVRTH